ncbi:TetR/AcrR family transcriptional regulator [Desulfovibrio sp. TomC]|uniref:TetR/AcrR family transcriptional regulator n=1 Tax=Desulfovibrio sp. TomC TaxID=1562888 RepID=UPI0005744BFA|nr:TetR/AcrR family transcriptional regulator [Desulfovibrio sp. TomC]KHK03039.1 Transcriptional regulator, TetR family [Desulfovibrio sp. TomC]
MSPAPYHHGNLRQELLTAGERLLETVGVEGLSLRALAREIGVSHSAPYRHFADKADLLAALAARGFSRLAQSLVATMDLYPDAHEARFLEASRRYIALGQAHPAMYRLMFGQERPGVGGQPELAESESAAYDALAASLTRGQEAGIFREGPVASMAMAAWAMVHGLTELRISGRLAPGGETEGETTQLGQTACTLLLNGILARSPAS